MGRFSLLMINSSGNIGRNINKQTMISDNNYSLGKMVQEALKLLFIAKEDVHLNEGVRIAEMNIKTLSQKCSCLLDVRHHDFNQHHRFVRHKGETNWKLKESYAPDEHIMSHYYSERGANAFILIKNHQISSSWSHVDWRVSSIIFLLPFFIIWLYIAGVMCFSFLEEQCLYTFYLNDKDGVFFKINIFNT